MLIDITHINNGTLGDPWSFLRMEKYPENSCSKIGTIWYVLSFLVLKPEHFLSNKLNINYSIWLWANEQLLDYYDVL